MGIGVAVVVAILLAVVLLQPKDKYNWSENYTYNKKQPFDNDLIYELLKAEVDKDSFISMTKPLAKSLKPSKVTGKASYVYIGDVAYLTEADLDTLLAFVDAGSDAFISINVLAPKLKSALSLSLCHDGFEDLDEWAEDEELTAFISDTTSKINLTHPSLAFKTPLEYTFSPYNKATEYNWVYFDTAMWCGGDLLVAHLGTVSGKSNFIRRQYGNGNIYLHTTPIAFTNYYMRDSMSMVYAENVFAHLQGGSIYWDEGSRYWHTESGEEYQSNPFGQSELKYILSQPASKWAFYTLLMGVLLYILFYMKRRQRIIPVLEPYANTSVEYVQTVGTLYFMKQEHRKLAEQQFKLFLSFVRNRYRLPTQHLDEALIKRLAMTSKIDEAQVRQLFAAYDEVSKQYGMSETQLITFNQYLEKFYQNCK